MAHLSLTLPLIVLTMPLVVLFVLRIAASIADARIAERSTRIVDAIEKAERMQPDVSVTSVSVLTEEADRDQG